MKITDLKLAVARKKLQSKAANSLAEGKECKLGIILDSGETDDLAPFLKLKEDLNLKEQEVNLVFCGKKGVKNAIFEYPLIDLEDFGWSGKLSEKSLAFLDFKYDVLISFTASKNKLADLLVSVARARLKVGRKTLDKNDIFDLNISVELSKPETFTEELKKYLKILNASN